MNEDTIIDLAVAHGLGEVLQPICEPNPAAFVTAKGYRTSELLQFSSALLATAGAAQPWQPISTAPTDGSQFLAFKPSVGHFVARILDMEHPDCEYDGGVHEAWGHKFVDDVAAWMPLPPPPAA